jgi:hypothetical protein
MTWRTETNRQLLIWWIGSEKIIKRTLLACLDPPDGQIPRRRACFPIALMEVSPSVLIGSERLIPNLNSPAVVQCPVCQFAY